MLHKVLVCLLDPISGRSVQNWRFESKSILRIGRGQDQDISIADPYVSRHHAEFQLRSGKWVLLAHGRNGVLVQDAPISEQIVETEVDFRLGPKGPMLRFQMDETENRGMATLDHDSDESFDFLVDEDKVQREVTEITDGDFFQNLKLKAQQLRRRGE